jgi:hypothetical protein
MDCSQSNADTKSMQVSQLASLASWVTATESIRSIDIDIRRDGIESGGKFNAGLGSPSY